MEIFCYIVLFFSDMVLQKTLLCSCLQK